MAPTKLISTSVGFQDAKGNVVSNGMLSLKLSQNALVTATNGQVTTESIYLPLDVNGKITSSAIWFNDELTPAGTTYRAVLYASNGCRIIQDFGFWSIVGASADLSTMVPASIGGPSVAGVVLTAPVNTQTVVQPSGTSLNVNYFENIRFADQFTGADASVKINAAIADVIAAGGGIVDCSNLSGAQTMSAAVAIGNASLVPVHLILPTTCTWTWSTNIGAGVNAVSLYPKSSISGPGSGEGNPCVLRAATGFTGNSLFALISVTATGDYYHASGFNVQVNSGATCTTAATIVTGMADDSLIQSIHTVVNSGATCPIGLQVIKSSFSSSLINCGVDANNNAGTTPAVFGDGANNILNVNIISPSFVHPGIGLPALSITGAGFTGDLNFYGLYVETGTSYDTTTALIQIAANTGGVQNFFGGRVFMQMAVATNYAFDIAAGARANIIGFTSLGNSDTNGINDHNKGTITIKTDSSGNIAPYSSYLSPMQIAIGGGPTSTTFANTMLTVFPDSSHRGIAISSQTDATLNALDLDSGTSAGQQTNLRFLDRGTAEWSVVKGSANAFRIIDNVDSNFVSMEMDQAGAGGAVAINAQSTGIIQINKSANSGTGGVFFGSGGASPTDAAKIDNAGNYTLLTANGAQWVRGSASELLTLSTLGTTTDTTANLLPANSIIEAVVARVTTTITVATDWKLGDPTTAGRFSAADSTMTANEVVVGTVQADQTGAAGPRQVAAAKVRVTTTGTPGAGVIRLTVFYRQFVGPTS